MSKPTYKQAFEELRHIVDEIENGQISVDELSEKVSRASDLISLCKEKLTTTEVNVKKILSAIEQPDTNADDEEENPDETQEPLRE